MATRVAMVRTPISATGTSATTHRAGHAARGRNGGFTLIELLVVVVIVAILSSLVLLSINVVGDDRELDREARRLVSLLEVAADEAELQGRDFGIEFVREGYRFVEYDPVFDAWVEIIGDDILRTRELPETIEFSLIIEDKRIRLADTHAELDAIDEDDDEDDERSALSSPQVRKFAPHAMIMSSGDLSPFRLMLVRPGYGDEELIRVEPTGQIEIGEEDDDA